MSFIGEGGVEGKKCDFISTKKRVLKLKPHIKGGFNRLVIWSFEDIGQFVLRKRKRPRIRYAQVDDYGR